MEYSYLNGKILPINEANININDLALLRAYGVFDFFRSIDGKPIFMKEHLTRFEASALSLHLKLTEPTQNIIENILELIQLNKKPLLGIKLICTGGYSNDGYTPSESPNFFITAKAFEFRPFEKGLKLMLVNHQREMPIVKTINYILPISKIVDMNSQKADDVLYISNNFITESSRSNVFIVLNGTLVTPDKGILHGITRKKILQFAAEYLPVEIRNFTKEELFGAEEVFLTSSTRRISPVTQIDENQYNIGQITRLLYDRLLVEELKD
ncbi:MAG: aminotransferase class IV [Saprospiraceae bacterium]|nr:aminotransferase class IV [Saprospiraceae bacterium]